MTNSSIFELQIANFVNKAKGNVNEVLRKISFEVFSQVVQISPVDTGRFRANWWPAIGSIPTGTTTATDKSGTAIIARIRSELLNAKAGDVLYLVNNLEYARTLEYGHSKRAPNGMVRITVTHWNSIVNKAASELPK